MTPVLCVDFLNNQTKENDHHDLDDPTTFCCTKVARLLFELPQTTVACCRLLLDVFEAD